MASLAGHRQTVILVDTDVLIAHLRGVEAARSWLLRVRTRLSERPWRGCWPLSISTRSTRWSLAEPVKLLRQYRRSHSTVGLGDYLIAATAEIEGFQLATLNV